MLANSVVGLLKPPHGANCMQEKEKIKNKTKTLNPTEAGVFHVTSLCINYTWDDKNNLLLPKIHLQKYWRWPVVPFSLLVETPTAWISKCYVTVFWSFHIHKIFGKLDFWLLTLEVKVTETETHFRILVELSRCHIHKLGCPCCLRAWQDRNNTPSDFYGWGGKTFRVQKF